ncbi:MAG: single-stranded DNA-binding protein [Patescibacteria group bacterium]|nr:single-stranded DNA-binding protein [Patescibacteria group bacterium]
MYLNKAMVFGNLTRDPELRALPSGGQVCSFGLATNRVYKKADGTKAEQAEFHNIVVFGRQAETCAQYLKKGSTAYVEGRLQTRSWEGEKGKQYRTEIIAERVQFGPRSAGSGGGAPRTEAEAPQKAPKEDAIEYPEETDINPDDIPF